MAGFLQVQGLRGLTKALKAAGDDLTDLKGLNLEAANVVVAAASPATPRRSGKLASTIRSSGTARAGLIRAGKSSVLYAGVIHWGWPRRDIRAQPWIADKAQATEERWTDVYLEGMNEILEKIVRATRDE